MLFRVFVFMLLCVPSFALIGGGEDDKEPKAHSAFLKGPPLMENQWLDVPPEVWMIVFKNLPLQAAGHVALVCKTFNAFDQDFAFWALFASRQQIEVAKGEAEDRVPLLKKAVIASMQETYFTFYSCFDAEIRLTVRYLYGRQEALQKSQLENVCLKSRQKIALSGMDFPRAHVHDGIKGIVSIARTDVLNQSGEVFGLAASPYLGTLCDRKSESNFLPPTGEFCDRQRTFIFNTASNGLRRIYY